MLISGVAGLSGCDQADNEAVKPALVVTSQQVDKALVAHLESEFHQRNHDASLVLPGAEQSTAHWSPAWEQATQRAVADSLLYVFIPLQPELHTQQQVQPITVANTRRFIIARLAGSELNFLLTTYIRENTATAHLAAPSTWFATFTGARFVQNLDLNRASRLDYQHGVAQRPKGTSQRDQPEDCHMQYICQWTSYCRDAAGMYHIFGTTTYSIDSCEEPGQEACGNLSWGMSWYLTGSTGTPFCTGTGDDPQDPRDPGGGGTDPNDPGNTPPTPCATMTGTSQSAAFQTARNNLSTQLGSDKEFAYSFRNHTDDRTYEFFQGLPSSYQVTIAPTIGPIGGTIHTHPNLPLSMLLFSSHDLQALYGYIRDGETNNPLTFTTTIITHYGVDYTLMVTDEQQFLAFGNTWLSSDDMIKLFEGVYYQDKGFGIANASMSIADREKLFLKMIQNENAGLTLLKHTQGSSGWGQLAVDPTTNSVVATPCP